MKVLLKLQQDDHRTTSRPGDIQICESLSGHLQ